MKMLYSNFEHSKIRHRVLNCLFLLLIIPTSVFAGWESYPPLTDPSDDDLILLWDVSDVTINSSGRTKYIKLTEFWEDYLTSNMSIWLGADPSVFTPNYFLKVKSTGNGIEESSTLNVDISGFVANSVIISDVNGKLQHHPLISSSELSTIDGATGNLENRIAALEGESGAASFAVTIGGESSNAITATFAHDVAQNYLVEAWLSASDGGTTTTAFDGNSGVGAWILGDATAHVTRTSNVAYQVLTGSDGDATVTFNHSDGASPATKYACFECQGVVKCGEVAFTTDETPCALADFYNNDTETDMGDAINSTGNLAQKIKGPPATKTICKVSLPITKAAGANTNIHLEVWTVGTSNAGATKSGDSVQIGGDSDTVTVSTTSETWYDFEWTENTPPELTAETDVFLHWVYEDATVVNTYWRGNFDETMYEDTNYDMWKTGADASKDGDFLIYLQ